MTQPTVFPDWAVDDRTWPVPGAPDPDNKEQPAASIITDGYAPADSTEGETLPLARNINYQFNLLGLWTRYLGQAPLYDNLCFGGNFDTNPWQRQIEALDIIAEHQLQGFAVSYHASDRFGFFDDGATPLTAEAKISKVANAPTFADGANIFSQFSDEIEVTTAQASIDADKVSGRIYNIEGLDWAQLAQRSFVVSFWAYSTKAGKYTVQFQNDTGDQSFAHPYTLLASKWTKIDVVIPASPASGSWNYGNRRGLTIQFALAVGSDYFGTNFDQWNAITTPSDFSFPSDHVNFYDTAGNRFAFQLINIHPGVIATDIKPRTKAQELDMCQRYYEKSLNSDEYPGVIQPGVRGYELIFNSSGGDTPHMFGFNTRKRPATTLVNPSPLKVITYSDVTGDPYNVRIVGGTDLPPITPNIGTNDGISQTNFNVETNTGVNTAQSFYWIADSEIR